ncbi:hypothetical protein BCR41DRAFT_360177 [Lobosporangium transversale]|uniref:DUF4238 domain-containing protein n=1 Tax=Lobosporangium transversale TaxID=64571 RepID=A0A1Y2GD85_9FUNG|nr:hypothetical protein BCR41DRAFT_360177 [Lobosporangium transversale]ORZ07547.1 hypothetical protein BCR41DRAFT_360177 [Lobosporangium transversale]|eukprot:XP_021878054.1 hypothetical protein BCR41DRAFT_360177 [Lobosporangium transversale]
MSQDQFHHYIPRFILKSFSDNFQLKPSSIFSPNASGNFTEVPFSKGPVGSKGNSGGDSVGSNRKGNRRKSSGINKRDSREGDKEGGHEAKEQNPIIDFPIYVYRALEKTIAQSDVSRVYGLQNMYQDIAEVDSMRFEKELAKLECTSATFIHKIRSGEELLLTRTQLADFKRFLAIMTYRSECRREQYYECRFDIMTLLSIRKHMSQNNIDRVQDVWFENLKWIIKTPHDEIIKESSALDPKGVKTPMDTMFALSKYKGPIHVAELMDYYNLVCNYVCVWQAEEGSEFILTDKCFGAFEGDMGVCFHNFYVVSPKYVVVLVNRLYMWDLMKTTGLRKSWFGDELHANPDVIYTKKPMRGAEDFTPTDVFKYKRIVVPKEKVYLCNSILLDASPKYITYKSDISMYRSLRYYDKTKEDLFTFKYGYHVLKREVLANLKAKVNRTHCS